MMALIGLFEWVKMIEVMVQKYRVRSDVSQKWVDCYLDNSMNVQYFYHLYDLNLATNHAYNHVM